MQNAVKKDNLDDKEVTDNEEYVELEITPALAKYLREVDEGKHLSPKTYNSFAEYCDDVFGKGWRDF